MAYVENLNGTDNTRSCEDLPYRQRGRQLAKL